jgi:hypothetical protein
MVVLNSLRVPVWIALAGCVPLLAEEARGGLLRGKLVEWQGAEDSGEIVLRAADTRSHTVRFDEKTYFEWRERKISVRETRPGDLLEVVADRTVPGALAYARIVKIQDAPPPLWKVRQPRKPTAYESPTAHFAPRGNLTFAGVVVEINESDLILQTQKGEKRQLKLRTDTRFVEGGARAPVEALQVHQRVFVRAGRNFEGEVEVYQVVWGDILVPR